MGTLSDKEKFQKLPIFFIVARERSGTTLLRTIFDAHPNVSIPVEFHFIWYMYRKYHRRRTWTKQQLEHFYNDLIKLPRYHLLTLDPRRLYNDLLSLSGETDYGTICKAVLTNYISFFPKKELLMVGDKCPLYSLHLAKLLKVFPEARIIHLTRDYRDNILSMLRVRIESHIFSSLAYRWKYYNRQVLKVREQYPESFFSLRYEDLVADPAVYIKKISDFLGLPFVPETLEFYKKKDDYMSVYPHFVFKGIHKNLFMPVTADHVYGWKDKMPAKLVRLADSIIAQDAELWGYERQFNKRNLWLLLLYWPGLVFGRLYYTWGSFVNFLPFGLKIRLVILLSWLFKRKWRGINIPNERLIKKQQPANQGW
jgi:hypothetical protein